MQELLDSADITHHGAFSCSAQEALQGGQQASDVA
jgi:hypothetical protein